MSFQESYNRALGQAAISAGLATNITDKLARDRAEKQELKKAENMVSQINAKDWQKAEMSAEERLDRMGDLAGIYKRIAEINPSRDNYDAYYQLLEDMRTVRENPDVDYSKRFDVVMDSKSWKEGAEATVKEAGDLYNPKSPYKLAAEKATKEAMDKLRASTGWIKRNPQTGKFERKKEEK